MLEEKDIQTISELLDQKLNTSEEKLTGTLTEKLTGTLTEKLTGTLTEKLTGTLTEKLTGTLTEKLTGTLTEKLTGVIDEKLDEVLEAVNDGFSEMQGQFNELRGEFNEMQVQFGELKEEMAKRPTRDEVFAWADRRMVDLEIGNERHDFLHIDELDKLPSPAEINKALIERGIKQKLA